MENLYEANVDFTVEEYQIIGFYHSLYNVDKLKIGFVFQKFILPFLALIYIVYALLTYTFSVGYEVFFIGCAIAMSAIPPINYFSIRRTCNKAYHATIKKGGKIHYSFYPESMIFERVSDAESNRVELQYQSLLKIVETRHFFHIFANELESYNIPKHAITGEQHLEFSKFLQTHTGGKYIIKN